jgi:ATP-dependent HslUV protease subunit HslV
MVIFHATTIVVVRKNGQVTIAGDGQVTFGQNIIMKAHARKIRTLYNGEVLAGFAGSVADALTLFEKFEDRLKESNGNLTRATVEVAREWRTDRVLRRLEALLVVADKDKTFLVSGNGEVIEPDDDVVAIGSGGPYALAAARALLRYSELPGRNIAEEALKIAAGICVYTNTNLTIEELG